MATLSQNYTYHQLDASRQQLRLIKLARSASSTAPPRCTIHVFELATAPKYVALSYTWGPPQPTHRIWIDNKTFEVRENLYNFLCTFQRGDALPQYAAPTDVEYLFIDQIGIDQSNVPEKNSQVRLMADIYTTAALVLVWLGQDPIMVQAARDYLDGMEDVDELCFPEAAVTTIISNSYFTRLWIVPEVSLARRVWMLCGDVDFGWDGLQLSVQRVNLMETRLHNIFPLQKLFVEKNQRGGRRLDEVAGNYCVQQCQNPRDKIYGFLGMVSADQRPAVDYAKSIQQVLADAVLVSLVHCWDNRFKKNEHGRSFYTSVPTCIRNLNGLARHMGLPEYDQRGLQDMLAVITDLADFLRDCDDEPPLSMAKVLTSIEYEGMAYSSVADGSDNILVGQWRMKVFGKKDCFDCTIPPGSIITVRLPVTVTHWRDDRKAN